VVQVKETVCPYCASEVQSRVVEDFKTDELVEKTMSRVRFKCGTQLLLIKSPDNIVDADYKRRCKDGPTQP